MEYLSAIENGLPLNPNNWFVPFCAICSSKLFHHHLLICRYLKIQVSMWNSVRSLRNTQRLPVLGLHRPSKGLSITEGPHLSSDGDVFLWELYQGIFSSPPLLNWPLQDELQRDIPSTPFLMYPLSSRGRGKEEQRDFLLSGTKGKREMGSENKRPRSRQGLTVGKERTFLSSQPRHVKGPIRSKPT